MSMAGSGLTPPIQEPYPGWSVQDVGKGLGLVVVLAILILTLALLVRRLYPDQFLALALGLTALLEVGMLVAVWLFGIRDTGSWRSVGLRLTSGPFAYSLLPAAVLLISLLATSIYVLVVSWAGAEILQPIPPMGLEKLEGPLRLVGALIVVGIGPFAEEVFFRGFVLAGLAVHLGVPRAIGISSLLFALAHLTPGVIVPIFIFGVLLAWLYLKTRSIVPGLVAHSAQNALAFLALG